MYSHSHFALVIKGKILKLKKIKKIIILLIYMFMYTDSYSTENFNFPSYILNKSMLNMSEIQPKGKKNTGKLKIAELTRHDGSHLHIFDDQNCDSHGGNKKDFYMFFILNTNELIWYSNEQKMVKSTKHCAASRLLS